MGDVLRGEEGVGDYEVPLEHEDGGLFVVHGGGIGVEQPDEVGNCFGVVWG